MMEDLAMHTLEILMNSVHAGARNIKLDITDSAARDELLISVLDDGKGMDEETAKRASDPFYTSRTTRKIGMGLAFFKGLAETCGGEFRLSSEPGKGTLVSASVQRSNIDTPPLGDIGEMMMETVQADGDIDYELTYVTDSSRFEFSTQEAKEMLDGVSILEPGVLLWIKEYINEGIKQVKEDIV
ncbi:MAG: sensor histidine kinase [Oscillospiraceae bacterium]|nr:sensor histidine kinase [Oscillospiraceae bacterium]